LILPFGRVVAVTTARRLKMRLGNDGRLKRRNVVGKQGNSKQPVNMKSDGKDFALRSIAIPTRTASRQSR